MPRWPVRTEAKRFWEKVDKTGTCWLWLGAVSTPQNYGHFTRDGRKLVYAHRWAYEHEVGPIPPGMQIDHLCGNHLCVNPTHLEAVTQQENMRRAAEAHRTRQRATVVPPSCCHGHALTAENIYWRKDGWWTCRECDRIRSREYQRRRRSGRQVDTALGGTVPV